MIAIRASFLLLSAIASGYIALRVWHHGNGRDATNKNGGFRPRIGFSRLDGMTSLSLLLANESDRFVWAEEIEVFLNGLRAEQQATEPSCHEIQKIRQTVCSGDTLPISLCEVIYKAAGYPQRRYSCVLSSVLRYRIGEEWFERSLENYKIRMIGLTVSGVHRERKPVPAWKAQEESQGVSAMAMKPK
ncbi:MAG TPA: hypothetical protein VGP19_10665 [Candidatus Acidoferrales bacterium]|jgi:hypothetical protein|nr:hypothetical protein [Candidatus Acidoferrales bacterium]